MFWQRKIRMPPRTSPSLEDSLKSQRQEMAGSGIGTYRTLATWRDEFKTRPFDIPRYLALHGVPTIIVFFSAQYVANSKTIDMVFHSERPWDLFLSSFLEGGYPVLRCNLRFPDNPRDPLVLESPLDIREGDVQAFFEAAMEGEDVDVLVTHEHLGDDSFFGAAFKAPGLVSASKKVLKKVVKKLGPDATRQDFERCVRQMEATFRSPLEGLAAATRIEIKPYQEPRNKIIDF